MANLKSANSSTPAALGYTMPAEWEPHAATWLGWPHNASDWPGKFEVILWIYGEMIRKISAGENIRLIVRHQKDEQFARHIFQHVGVDLRKIQFVIHPTNRGWTRDAGPIFVRKAESGKRKAETNQRLLTSSPTILPVCLSRFSGGFCSSNSPRLTLRRILI